MLRHDTKLMESAVALAEELHFSNAARRVGISQPMLTKNIQDLEHSLGGELFFRNRKEVRLTDAGRVYIEQARLALLYGERAFHAARKVMQDVDVVLNIGKSPYTDPFLISMLQSIRLPLFPSLKIQLQSSFSCELVRDVLSGILDLAIVTEPPESSLLTKVKVAESPLYIAMSKHDSLASRNSLSLEAIADRRWILFERRLHPPLYDMVMRLADERKVSPSQIQHITMPEEAFPSVVDGSSIAFLVKAGALLLARHGVTVRPLLESSLLLKTYLASRADNDSRIASEFVRAYMRKGSDINRDRQLKLPMSA
jgi:DNA-binding transcriptional LysR family regulator